MRVRLVLVNLNPINDTYIVFFLVVFTTKAQVRNRSKAAAGEPI